MTTWSSMGRWRTSAQGRPTVLSAQVLRWCLIVSGGREQRSPAFAKPRVVGKAAREGIDKLCKRALQGSAIFRREPQPRQLDQIDNRRVSPRIARQHLTCLAP